MASRKFVPPKESVNQNGPHGMHFQTIISCIPLMHSPETSSSSSYLKLGCLSAVLFVCAVYAHFITEPVLHASVHTLQVRTMEDELPDAHVGSKYL